MTDTPLPPFPRRRWRRLHALALPLAVAALALSVYVYSAGRQSDSTLTLELSRRLAATDRQLADLDGRNASLQEQNRLQAGRLERLERQLAEMQTQRLALETMHRDLVANRDAWALAEVEQILIIASEQLQLSGNMRGALTALGAADQRLRGLDKPLYLPLRRAISQDIAALEALPHVDISGMSFKLDRLIREVPNLPLLAGAGAREATRPGRAAPAEGGWQRLSREIWEDLHSLVRIQHLTQDQVPVVSPDQAFFLKENLRLRLLAARLALLQRDETTFKNDLREARRWLHSYFNGSSAAVVAALAQLDGLSRRDLTLHLPDASASLRAVRLLRDASGRGPE